MVQPVYQKYHVVRLKQLACGTHQIGRYNIDTIILTNGSIFDDVKIYGTFVPYKDKNDQKLTIRNIQHTDELVVKLQLQLELQQSVFMNYKPNLSYKFDCLVGNTLYCGMFIETIEFLEPVDAEDQQRYTITLAGRGLDLPKEVV